MDLVMNIRKSITINDLVVPSKEDLNILSVKIQSEDYLKKIYKVPNHIYGYIYLNRDNTNVTCVAFNRNNQIIPLLDESMLRVKDLSMDEIIKAKDYDYCMTMADGQFKGIVFELLKDKIDDPSILMECFLEAYSSIDYGFEALCDSLNMSLLLKKRRMTDEELSNLSEYIDENGYVKIYRSQASKSTKLEKAISWTVSLDVATDFAYRSGSNGNPVIYTGEVHYTDITAYYTQRGEYEIIVDYNLIKDVKKY